MDLLYLEYISVHMSLVARQWEDYDRDMCCWCHSCSETVYIDETDEKFIRNMMIPSNLTIELTPEQMDELEKQMDELEKTIKENGYERIW